MPAHELIEFFNLHGGLSRQYSYTISLLLSSDFRHRCNYDYFADIGYYIITTLIALGVSRDHVGSEQRRPFLSNK